MAYDESFAGRIRDILRSERGVMEKKMFGGICFMVHGNMCVGIAGDDLMVRCGPAEYEQALKAKHARPMDFTGRPMKGFVFVSPDGTKTAAQLKKWTALGVAFAKSLPRK
ncbi:MAG: TfoX/Sxy family protein [Candidatus Omnitrophica bacterium]|nr:TfoX/Sxy family protein [Candidatus Omnitrophota bacterium]